MHRGLLVIVTIAFAVLTSACSGDLFHDTSWADANACDPSVPSDELRCAEGGVFVRNEGDDGADGSLDHPVQTLQHALDVAQGGGKRVYACGQTFAEHITVPPGVTIYGALDCASDWHWNGGSDATLTTIAPSDEGTAVVLGAGEGTTALADLKIDAHDATSQGGSSIAVYVDGVTASILRSRLTAGAALPGADGIDPMGSAAAGNDGTPGQAACAIPVMTAATPAKSCAGETSGGGSGAVATPVAGAGAAGTPSGLGGAAGQPDVGCVSGGNGGTGANGDPGDPGAGGVALGTLADSTYAGDDGKPGVTGHVGQGGGGGASVTVSSCMSGPGGGSGGTGGCGGSGGVGGHAGGSSIALASADAHVTIANTNLRAGAGGAGGRGARGQIGGQGGTGQAGGAGAPGGVSDACAGGNGGKGGNGGPGGGGRGGHSLGIASHGAPVTRGAGVFIATGMAGGGGLDGSDTTANAGDDGKAADELDFSAAP